MLDETQQYLVWNIRDLSSETNSIKIVWIVEKSKVDAVVLNA